MSELWAVVRAPCTSSTVRMFFRTRRSRIAMAIAPPTMAVPSGRLAKDAFDMTDSPKKRLVDVLNETAHAGNGGGVEKKDRARAQASPPARARAPIYLREI